MSRQRSKISSNFCVASVEDSANDSEASVKNSPDVAGGTDKASDVGETCAVVCSIGVALFEVDFDSFKSSEPSVILLPSLEQFSYWSTISWSKAYTV